MPLCMYCAWKLWFTKPRSSIISRPSRPSDFGVFSAPNFQVILKCSGYVNEKRLMYSVCSSCQDLLIFTLNRCLLAKKSKIPFGWDGWQPGQSPEFGQTCTEVDASFVFMILLRTQYAQIQCVVNSISVRRLMQFFMFMAMMLLVCTTLVDC